MSRETPIKSQSVRAEPVEALWFRGVRFDRLNANGLIRYFPSGKRCIFVLLALLGIGAWLASAQRGGFHPSGMPCEGCHLAGDATRPEQAHLLIGTQENLCGNCHPAALKVSHPSGFTPARKPPTEYPLDWKGELTCSTCHDVHGKLPGYLRNNRRNRELCMSCHDKTFFANMKDQGGSMQSGHYVAAGISPLAKIDPYSVKCMECHETNGDNAISVNSSGIVRHLGSSLNHPIGGKYADAVDFGGYRKQNQLSRKIMLPGGLMSCVSCHEGYSKQHGKLAASLAGSALCFECHDI